MLKVPRSGYTNFILGQEVNLRLNTIKVPSQAVFIQTRQNESNVHLLLKTDYGWQKSLEKVIPYGEVLSCFVSDNIILIITPSCCILMDWNLTEKSVV